MSIVRREVVNIVTVVACDFCENTTNRETDFQLIPWHEKWPEDNDRSLVNRLGDFTSLDLNHHACPECKLQLLRQNLRAGAKLERSETEVKADEGARTVALDT